ncbi:MAG: 23S rRNA (adenine(2503)-C(2))-methyltransferase RlmN [Acidimicrobiales bacterium]|jgi:23S rRNA (adenine2503-C2)-methyltransferase
MPGRYDVDFDGLSSLIQDEPSFRSTQVWDGLYRRSLDPLDMTDLPRSLRERLDSQLHPSLRLLAEYECDDGDTVKSVYECLDGSRVESVLMAYPDRVTVCISTQAGCAMACKFCATGQAGFSRNLSSGEIVEQVVKAIQRSRPRRVTHVVLMGMGEPFANYDRVWNAVVRIHSDIGVSARRITMSTVGIIPGIRRLSTATLPVNLAVSLHAANDQLRDRLVPINRRYPLSDLAEALQEYIVATGRRLSFEWALIAGVNDRRSDVCELAEYARPLNAHVNLIPLDPTSGFEVPATPHRKVLEFRENLAGLGINVTVRKTRGVEIQAACGQLSGDPVAAPLETTNTT